MLKRIRIEDVRVGMFLHKLEGSWLSHPFWKSKFLIERQEQLDDLLTSNVGWVQIDVSRGADLMPEVVEVIAEPEEMVQAAPVPAPAEPAPVEDRPVGRSAAILGRARREEEAAPAAIPRAVPPVVRSLPPVDVAPAFAAGVKGAADIARRSRGAVHEIFEQSRLGKTADIAGIEPLVGDIMHSIQDHPHAFGGVVRLMKNNDYLHRHALAVCGLMINLAMQLSLKPDQVRTAGLAGLLMDIGMSHVPSEIYDKQGTLTPAETEIVQSHTRLAHDFMAIGGDIPPAVLDVCLHHHERMDGSGYPHGLKGEQISLFARMAAICDIYDAMTSHRPHKGDQDPAQAVAEMSEMSGIDRDLFDAFVRAIGIYPVGSLVRLRSERLAMVLDQNPKNPTLPRVLAFYSTAERRMIPPEHIELVYRVGRDGILTRERPENWGFDEDWDKLSTHLFNAAAGGALR